MHRFILLALALAGCASSVEREAQDAVAAKLTDPNAAEFRDVHTGADGQTVCGEVNAKNALGGYVGFERFIRNKKASYLSLEATTETPSVFEINWKADCSAA